MFREDDYLFDPLASPEARAAVKARWGPGPWLTEPDRVQWWHEGPAPADGPIGQYALPCLCLRGPWGAWNGYIGLRPGHPWYGQSEATLDVAVHGGITYAGESAPPFAWEGPNMAPRQAWWVLGFDCAHAGDFCPGLEAVVQTVARRPWALGYREVYRDLAYARAETARLAEQAAAIMEGANDAG